MSPHTTMNPVTTASLTDLLAALVDIPSETGHEDAIAEFVVRRLRSRQTGEVLRSGLSVVWRGPQHGRPLVVLAGHLDTVPAQDNADRKSTRLNSSHLG